MTAKEAIEKMRMLSLLRRMRRQRRRDAQTSNSKVNPEPKPAQR